MPKIVTETGELNTLNISVRDTKFWLPILKVFDQTTGQMGNTWRECLAGGKHVEGVVEEGPRQCSNRLCAAPGQTM